MDASSYDLNIRRLGEDIVRGWEEWGEKPKDPHLRLGYLEEPTDHPEFLEILKGLKPKKYFTCGRILGTLGDPRRTRYLDGTLESEVGVILRWSDTPFCKRAYSEIKRSGIGVEVEVKVGKKEDLRRFWEGIWDEEDQFILTPERDQNGVPRVLLTSDDLKDKENTHLIEYPQNILMTDKKIIITENSINLKPIKVYDRI